MAGILHTTDDIFSWLSSFISLETGLGGKPDGKNHFKLDRIRILSDLAEHPESCAPVIHIAGSKGKGSVTAMIGSVLEKGGIKTARYTSPHISDWRERVCRGDGSFFPDNIYVSAGKELQDLYERYRKFSDGHFTKDIPDMSQPTFFELITILFFLCTRLDNCKAMAVETGLGGRLDATNIIDPVVSVITVIEKEHTEYLGTTLTSIAGEKAGIIKQGRPVVSAQQQEEVLEVLRSFAEKNAASFVYAPDCVTIRDICVHNNGTDFTLELSPNGKIDFTRRFSLAIPGAIQADNAALALLALTIAFPLINETSMEQGLSASRLPARFEKLRANPPFIVDGAHTPLSVSHCVNTFCALYGGGLKDIVIYDEGILLFGCAADKDAEAMAAILLPCFTRCIITSPGYVRVSNPTRVYEIFCVAARQYSKSSRVTQPDIRYIPDTTAAIEETLRLSEEKNSPVLCCGSFYLAAEVHKVFSSNPSISRKEVK